MPWQIQPLIWMVVIAILALLAIPHRALPAPSQADIEACRADAIRLCKAEIDRKDYPAAGSCVIEHRKELSKGCRKVLERVQAKGKDKNKKHPKIVVRVPVIVPIPVPKPPIAPSASAEASPSVVDPRRPAEPMPEPEPTPPAPAVEPAPAAAAKASASAKAPAAKSTDRPGVAPAAKIVFAIIAGLAIFYLVWRRANAKRD